MKIREKYEKFDARKVHEDFLREISHKALKNHTDVDVVKFSEESLILRIVPSSAKCLTNTPIGPCMVSVEGSCNIEYRYSGRKRESANVSER